MEDESDMSRSIVAVWAIVAVIVAACRAASSDALCVDCGSDGLGGRRVPVGFTFPIAGGAVVRVGCCQPERLSNDIHLAVLRLHADVASRLDRDSGVQEVGRDRSAWRRQPGGRQVPWTGLWVDACIRSARVAGPRPIRR